ncbi:MAG: PQQ-dependent sugar dehydrogenase [Chloroflexi bacterium]|nr:PQQ-dependent sugar dehydrogenase [Chloroflexota bacterium]
MKQKQMVFVLLGVLALACTACGIALKDPPRGETLQAPPTRPPTATLDAPTEIVILAATRTVPPPTDAPTATKIPPTATQVPPTATKTPTRPAPTDTRVASNNGSFSLAAEPLISDLTRPVFVTHAGDGTGRLFVVEQPGRIWIAENGRLRAEPFLDIRDKITTRGNEQGLLGLAFHPDYKNNGLFFVNYSRAQDGDNVIARYRVSDDPNTADANSEQILFTVDGLEPNHNGGMLAFGPDGYLYVGTGDGGGAGDRHGSIGNGQNLNTLLGKILRLDVNADTYQIPPTNPFVNQANARPEIWAYGLRNPWRFSFDRATGDLYIADVGQNSKEEVDFQPASSKGGENYGWRILEGDECYDENQNCARNDLIAPIVFYSHDLGCSITGGYVYRGQKYPWLVGTYIFADYCSGIVWATTRNANGQWQTNRVGKFDDDISSFGEDEVGELYVVGHGNGVIYKLTAAQ